MSAASTNNSCTTPLNNRQDHVPLCMAKKWLPVTHRHGCAIYCHQNTSGEQQDMIGGELMVSAIIRGTPTQCLAALTGSRQGNSILGPATAVDVLQQSADGSQVLCIHLAPPAPNTAAAAFPSISSKTNSSSSSPRRPGLRVPSVLTGLCSRFLGARVAVVQQTLWQDPRGIYCLTFKSVSPEALSSLQQQEQQQGQQQHGQQQMGSAHQPASHLPSILADSDPHHSNSCCCEQQAAQHAAHDTSKASSGHTWLNDHGLAEVRQQQQQLGHKHQRPLQQQLRHRASASAPGTLSGGNKKQQAGQQLQLHACCHSNTTGGSNSSSSCTHSTQQQRQQQPHLQQPHQAQLSWQQQQQHQAHNHQHQGLLQPVYSLLRIVWQWLAFLASLLGLQHFLGCSSCSSSSSSSSTLCGLFGPVQVCVVGGFTVAGLDSGSLDAGSVAAAAAADGGGSNTGLVQETLVTSILKVDLGGCLAGGGPTGGCNPLHSAAVVLGLVDVLRGQMLSAVERVKAEVEHPAATRADNQVSPAEPQSPSLLQGLLAQLASIGSMALAPLTTWQALRTQQQQPQQPQQQQQQKEQARKSSGGQQPLALYAVHSRAAAISSSAGHAPASPAGNVSQATGHVGPDHHHQQQQQQQQQLVGCDPQGNPLTGICNPAFWSPLHQPGYPSVFQVRGPTYLADRIKAPAGSSAYTLLAVDLVSTPSAVQHLARFLPSIRRSRAASAFVVNMMVPAADDVMNLVMTWGSSRPWPTNSSSSSTSQGSSSNGSGDEHRDVKASSSSSSRRSGGSRAPSNSSDGGGAGRAAAGLAQGAGSIGSSGADGSSSSSSSSKGFDNALRRFLLADDHERSNMFKMIPHIEVGPWMLQGMVGSTPVIMGRKLATTYHLTERYMEVDIDVTTCRTAGFIVQSIRGATTSLVVDLCYLLEGQRPQELPEVLLGAVRFSNIDMSATAPVDTTTEIPCWPQPWEPGAGSDL